MERQTVIYILSIVLSIIGLHQLMYKKNSKRYTILGHIWTMGFKFNLEQIKQMNL